MRKFSGWLRDFFGGLVGLAGATLVAWHAVLAYYLITGRLTAGEENPPLGVAAVLILIGVFLMGAGYRIAAPRKGQRPND